jgi:hypothetical protein
MSFFQRTKIESNERIVGRELREAFERARNRKKLGRFDKSLIDRSHCDSLLAVNPYARISWNKIVCEQIDLHLCEGKDSEPTQPLYFVTLLNVNCATAISGEMVDIEKIKRGLKVGLRGLSHIGIIEPAFYTNMQVGVRYQGKRCLFWHIHALVWGISKAKLRRRFLTLETSGLYPAIAEGFRGTHFKKIKAGQLPKTTGYMLKSPTNAYRVGRRDLTEPNGDPLINGDGEIRAKFFHRKSRLRKGERITLFLAMKGLRLDRMAVAGGEGSPLLARAKRIALST